MSKHIKRSIFLELPSGKLVHPYRLIIKDGSLMWKHALISRAHGVILPESEAHENHIIKTAQRLEELNSWVSHDLNPWDSFSISKWYLPKYPELSEGISVYFNHPAFTNEKLYSTLAPHIQDHENLILSSGFLYFQRC